MGLLQKLLGIQPPNDEYEQTLWCYGGVNEHGDYYIPCLIVRESPSETLVARKSDNQHFWVGVRDEFYSDVYGWITVFYEDEAEWVD